MSCYSITIVNVSLFMHLCKSKYFLATKILTIGSIDDVIDAANNIRQTY